MTNKISIGIIGVGTLGESLVKGIQASPLAARFSLAGSRRTESAATEVTERFGIPCFTDNKKLGKDSNVLLLAVKPHQAEAAVVEVAPSLHKGQLLVSLCASLTLEKLHAWTNGRCALVRAMPNTPATVGEAMTVLCAGSAVSDEERQKAEAIFSTVGRTAWLEESLMDAATGLSGCGPAYVFLMIEALSEAGVKLGISRKTSTLLAAQTLLGAAKMVLERGAHPAAMKDEVTTPAGCTVDGLMALEEGKLRVTLIKGVLAAARRSRGLVPRA
jgi:pyrroline-5-carboxylate reductase